MLTHESVELLKRPFPPEDHDFRTGGGGRTLTYLREDAVTRRLDEVDPNWTYEIVNVSTYPQARADGSATDTSIVVHVRMTVDGVTRESVGMALMSDASGEGFKSAETDALKRVARRFGVGQYLVRTPSFVRDETSIAKWLSSGTGTQSENRPEPLVMAHWRTLVKNNIANDEQHAKKSIRWLLANNYIQDNTNASDLLEASQRARRDHENGGAK